VPARAASSSMPLLETDLYAEVRDQMITHGYDYFDLIHNLLPTSLPLKEFHEGYATLAWTTGKADACSRPYPR